MRNRRLLEAPPSAGPSSPTGGTETDAGALAVLAVLLLAGSGLVAIMTGYRLPVVASRPSRVILALLGGVLLAGAIQQLFAGRSRGRDQPDNLLQLLVGLSLLCAAVSLLLSPAD